MAIISLKINNFRNLIAAELALSPKGLNVICGDNGSGKTSLLEAIHYLGVGKSFRTSTSSRIINHQSDKFSVVSQLLNDNECQIPLGLERNQNGDSRLRIAEKDANSLVELAALLPLRLINSQSHNIFESGPSFRRKYLDWGLFYQFESFFPTWRQYERVLKQRNALLRNKRPKKELDAWTDELVKYGLELDQLRKTYIKDITPLIKDLCQDLLGFDNLGIQYLPGWDETLDFRTAISESFVEEFRMGYTQLGPQRADLEITVDDVSVRHFLSRGQQKLLICAMILAQGLLLARETKKGLIYLVDDLPSELDSHSKTKLLHLLAKQQNQIFITAIESKEICEVFKDKSTVPMKVFHVEHGTVRSGL